MFEDIDLQAGIRLSVSSGPLDPEWDAFVDAVNGGHHLQTSLWGQVKARHGWRAVRLKQHRADQIVAGGQLLVRTARIGSIAYLPRGPLTIDREPATCHALISGLEALARRERILYLKVQPPAGRSDLETLLVERGFVASDLPAAPVATVRVGVQRDPKEILAEMRSSTRANIRKATRKGVTVRAVGPEGLPDFGRLLDATSRRQRFAAYPLDYYADILSLFGQGRRAALLLAQHGEQTVSAVLIVGYGDTAVYKMGAWSGEHTDLHPNELLHWQAIQWAREHGYLYYDLEGIAEPVARAKLSGARLPRDGSGGTTHFKLGMGGEVILYPRAYDRSFHPMLAWPTRLLAPRLMRFQAVAHRLIGRSTQ